VIKRNSPEQINRLFPANTLERAILHLNSLLDFDIFRCDVFLPEISDTQKRVIIVRNHLVLSGR